ncbi:MAG: DUF2264 domain-containing protein [Spirochaetaceae bacterium]
MIFKEIENNPINSKEDLTEALISLIKPLSNWFSHSNTFVIPGSNRAFYTVNGAGFEGYSRPFWGILSAVAGGTDEKLLDPFLSMAVKGLKCGVDPNHKDYWGDTFDLDQKFVEMAVIGLSLIMSPLLIWNKLELKDQNNFKIWFESVNDHAYPANNWLFFRIFVNIGLNSVCGAGSQEMVEKDFAELESYYLGNGWYSDGKNDQFDYYISFGMHFYGMLYAGIMGKKDPKRSLVFKERAAIFAVDFKEWFAPGGEAVAFGRSQTYRFAQGSFWSAAAFCNLHENSDWLTPGIIKGMVLRHFRWWFGQPIFTESGLLSIGYSYPNLIMAEGYNAPGSPYWGMKTFFVLALADDSDFWLAKEEDLPINGPEVSLQKHPKFLVCRDKISGDVTFLNGGQFAGFEPRHNKQKYSKLSYSSRFAFSVPTGNSKISEQGGDNTLMLKTEFGLWLHRGKTVNHKFTEKALTSDWVLNSGIVFRTIQTWMDGCQVRIHLVKTDKDIEFCEGGCVCPIDDDKQLQDNILLNGQSSYYTGNGHYSHIQNITIKKSENSVEAWNIAAEPNSNLIFPRTAIPSLIRRQSSGIAMWASVVCAGLEKFRNDISNININTSDTITISGKTEKIEIPREWLIIE